MKIGGYNISVDWDFGKKSPRGEGIKLSPIFIVVALLALGVFAVFLTNYYQTKKIKKLEEALKPFQEQQAAQEKVRQDLANSFNNQQPSATTREKIRQELIKSFNAQR